MKKQGFLAGSLTLIVSVIITKVIGAVFRIPLANMLDGTGMGYYSAAYGLFTFAYAFLGLGLSSAVAKIISEKGGAGARRIRKTALVLFGAAGLFFSILCIPIAFLYCKYIYGSPDALPSVLAIIPSVLFCSLTSVLRGYYEGMQNFRPTAVSNIAESVVKLIFGLFLCSFVIKNGGSEAFAAAAAIIGVSLSTLAGTLYLAVLTAFSKREKKPPETAEKTSAIAKTLVSVAVPISLASLAVNLTNLIDITAVIPSLKTAVALDVKPFLPVIRSGVAPEMIPQFIFGSFMGLAVTVFNLIPAFTNMFGKGILPPFSAAYAKNQTDTVKKLSEGLLFTVSVIAIPCGLGITALASPILRFLFPARPAETAAAAVPLAVLGISVIFLTISSAIFSAFQAAGRGDLPVKLMCAGVVVKLAGNLLLVPVPDINITGAALSTLFCYALIFALSLVNFEKITKLSAKRIFSVLFAPTFCGLLCAVSAKLFWDTTDGFGDAPRLIFSIAAGGAVYLLSGFLAGIFSKQTINNLTETL
jgi:stage V sporulation protein B